MRHDYECPRSLQGISHEHCHHLPELHIGHVFLGPSQWRLVLQQQLAVHGILVSHRFARACGGKPLTVWNLQHFIGCHDSRTQLRHLPTWFTT
jgi:hypothetical protein